MTTYWSRNDEDYSYDSLQELLANHDDLDVGDMVHCGEGVYCDPGMWVHADDVIEQLACRAYDECGDIADDYPDVSPDAKKELDDILEAWARKYCTPSFYVIMDAQDYEITTVDIDEANK